MSCYNKSDKKNVKLTKIFLNSLNHDELKEKLITANFKTRLQLKNSKMVLSAAFKYLTASTITDVNLRSLHARFQAHYSRRGVLLPETSEVLQFLQIHHQTDNFGTSIQIKRTSTPKKTTREIPRPSGAVRPIIDELQ